MLLLAQWCTSTAASSQCVLHHVQNKHQQKAEQKLLQQIAHPTMNSSCNLVEDLAILTSVLTQSFGQLLNSEYALSGIQNLAVTCCQLNHECLPLHAQYNSPGDGQPPQMHQVTCLLFR